MALTSNVVTVTTAAAHGLIAGNYATVSSTAHAAINGYFALASAPTTTTFTYALTGTDIVSVADTGVVIPDTYDVLARKDIATIIAKTITQSGMIKQGTELTATTFFEDVPSTGFALILGAKPEKWDGQKRHGVLFVQFFLYFSAPKSASQTLYSFENIRSKIFDDLANTTNWTRPGYVADELSCDGPEDACRTDAPGGTKMIYQYTFTVGFVSAAGTA